MDKVLIIEDDNALARGLKDNFEFNGYQVLLARNGESGLDMALSHSPDLIILDIMLPGINGFEICRAIRQEKIDVPILILTAKDEEGDVVLGLKLGADDYVTKPFSIKELLARSEAILRRRGGGHPQTQFHFGECELDTESRIFRRNGKEIKLSPKEFDLLLFFLQNAGKALSREKIMNEVWGYGSIVTPRSIDRFVTTLRSKIEKTPQHPQHIETLRDFGYRFSAASLKE